MRYQIDTREGAIRIRVDGRWTFQDHQTARQLMADTAALNGRGVVMDVTELAFVDSAAVGMLLIANEEMAKAGKRLDVVGARGPVERVFRTICLPDLLQHPGRARPPARSGF